MNKVLELYDKHGMQSVSCVAPASEPATDFSLNSVKVNISKKNLSWFGGIIADSFNESKLFDDVISSSTVTDLIHRFYDEYVPNIPSEMRARKGSTSDDGLLCGWLLLHAVRPECYIESGVFVGSSLRLADVAMPNAKKWAYDLSFSPLLYQADHITYIANEWSEELPDLKGCTRSFAFFDDHIDPVRRIQESHEVGIEWVLFDDSPTFAQLYPYRYPAIPTVSMILDDHMPDGAIVEWTPFGEKDLVRYTHEKKYCQTARNLISAHIDMRGLMSKIGLSCGDKAVVRLKRKSRSSL